MSSLTVNAEYGNFNDYFEVYAYCIDSERDEEIEKSKTAMFENFSVSWKRNARGSSTCSWIPETSDEMEELNPGDSIKLTDVSIADGQTSLDSLEGKIGKLPSKLDPTITANFEQDYSGLDSSAKYDLTKLPNPVTYDRMWKAIASLCDVKDCVPSALPMTIRTMLIQPSTVEQRTTISSFDLRRMKANFTPPGDRPLNSSQHTAVETALKSSISLIQGPPGTGKTKTSAVIVYELVKTFGKKVIVCAPSNVAVDNLAAQIEHVASLYTNDQSKKLRVVRLYSRTLESTNENKLGLHMRVQTMKEYKDALAQHGPLADKPDERKMSTVKYECERKRLNLSEVVCCTCTGAGDRRFDGRSKDSDAILFDCVLIDECAQSTEPQCIIPIVKTRSQIILVGDQMQLGPVVKSSRASEAGFELSLFERLLKLGIGSTMLDTQFRMNPSISSFPSLEFYGGKLKDGVHGQDHLIQTIEHIWPVLNEKTLFLHSCSTQTKVGQSLLNDEQKRCAVLLVHCFVQKLNIRPSQIGIITPYLGQRQAIRNHLIDPSNRTSNLAYADVEVETVNSFQGREKDIIIFSTVRSINNKLENLGFLKDIRRLNVAITRAKFGLVILGNAQDLKKHHVWQRMLRSYESRNILLEGKIDEKNALFFAKLKRNRILLGRPE